MQQGYCSSTDEVSAAQKAAKEHEQKPTIFSKIIDKSIPADIVHEDDKVSIKSRKDFGTILLP